MNPLHSSVVNLASVLGGRGWFAVVLLVAAAIAACLLDSRDEPKRVRIKIRR